MLLVLILFPSGLAGLCYDLRDWALRALATRKGAATPGAGTPVEPALAP